MGALRVYRHKAERGGGMKRVTLLEVLPEAPSGTTIAAAHSLPDLDLAGVQFYTGVAVSDPDDSSRVFTFQVTGVLLTHVGCSEVTHCQEHVP
jgi:hypothetical protein